MVKISLYFKIHKPFLLKEYKVFDVGNSQDYFDVDKNKYIIRKSGEKYIKNNNLLLKLIKRYPDKFKIIFAISGTTLELMNLYAKDVLESFQELAATGNVEFLGETYYHSLSFLYSKEEYVEQIKLHTKAIQKFFKLTPTTYRNTRLRYCNDIAQAVNEAGINNIFIEHNKRILNWRNQNKLYSAPNNSNLITKNSQISNQIKESIKTKTQNIQPILNILNQTKENEICNICFKYNLLNSSFAQEFFENLTNQILNNPSSEFITTNKIIKKIAPIETLDIKKSEDILTTQTKELWFGNKMQITISNKVYSMEKEIKKTKDTSLLDSWRKFTTSNNFYFLNTKSQDPSSTKYQNKFQNIYGSPYDAYTYFITALQDLIQNVEKKILIIETTPEEITDDIN